MSVKFPFFLGGVLGGFGGGGVPILFFMGARIFLIFFLRISCHVGGNYRIHDLFGGT